MSYKAAVIGLGQIGLMYDFDPKREPPSSHVLAYEQDDQFQLVAAADLQLGKQEKLVMKAPKTVFFENYKEMLAAIPQLDIISICTPASQHLRNIEHILEIAAPRIIFCEKPLASNLLEIQKIRELAQTNNTLIIPNLTRRFLSGMQEVSETIERREFGKLQKIDARYTRGIYNTGAHLFDLIRWFGGEIEQVRVLGQTATSSDIENEPSYSFMYTTSQKVSGFVEAFDDRQYYLFELDLYFEAGKVEIRNSSDAVSYYEAAEHSLFTGLKGLKLIRSQVGILSESALSNAIRHFGCILLDGAAPLCSLNDAIQPLFVADALQKSAQDQSWVKVERYI